MAAVTSPETSPQPRVYFQTPAGTTEEPETPVRKQGRVTVKYDRKELRKRLNLEEWIIDQLTDLYDSHVDLTELAVAHILFLIKSWLEAM
uniref:Protein phosphatase 1, regulatory (inhibitor) subunit 14Bb n=1 Tax=Labrus bergylta TaxID=56723 RepID=A0A3Q3G962_9LABR